MNLKISGHHLDITPALHQYIVGRLEKIRRHVDQVIDVNVLLTVNNASEKSLRHQAEITLHVKGKDFFIEQTHEDMYAAIDLLMDRLDRAVVRHRQEQTNHHGASIKRLAAGL